jgi:integrase
MSRERRRERGSGSLFQEWYRDPRTGEKKQTETWTMKLWSNGKPLKRSSGETSVYRANKRLEAWKKELAAGTYVPDAAKTTFDTLSTILINEYKANGRRSADRVEDAVEHLREFFTKFCPARAITTDRVLAYVRRRQEEKAANATINRELAALRRMFSLGMKAGKVAQRPHVDMLQENNVRKSFFEPDAFRSVLSRVSDDLKPVFEVAYITGWRVKLEILTRRWQHVDFRAGWLRLEPGETKNGDGRMFPLTPDLRETLERQRRRTQALEKKAGQIIPWVFHRAGLPVKSFRRAWRTACKNAGVPGRIPHDFRRTAVRNLERAGVSRSAAMAMVGHKTESIYRRYAIVAESDLRDGAEKIQALHEQQRRAERKKPRMARKRLD